MSCVPLISAGSASSSSSVSASAEAPCSASLNTSTPKRYCSDASDHIRLRIWIAQKTMRTRQISCSQSFRITAHSRGADTPAMRAASMAASAFGRITWTYIR